MAIDWPDSPGTGNTYTYAGNTWEYTGVGWRTLGASVPGPTGPAGAGIGYSVYCATLTQTGTNAPIPVQVFQDDLGDVTFAYGSTGYYAIQSPSFVHGKTFVNGLNPYVTSLLTSGYSRTPFVDFYIGSLTGPTFYGVYLPGNFYDPITSTDITIRTYGPAVPKADYINDVLSYYNLFVDIRVYP